MQNQGRIERWKKLLDQTAFSKNFLILFRLFQKETLYKSREKIRIIRHGRVYRVQAARLNQSRKRYHPKKFLRHVSNTLPRTPHTKLDFAIFLSGYPLHILTTTNSIFLIYVNFENYQNVKYHFSRDQDKILL